MNPPRLIDTVARPTGRSVLTSLAVLAVLLAAAPAQSASLQVEVVRHRLDNGMTMVLSGIAPGDRVYPNPGPDMSSRVRGN